ncbi:MAG: hypothetical protein ACRD22_18185, partial [Terriglobia bacterium]
KRKKTVRAGLNVWQRSEERSPVKRGRACLFCLKAGRAICWPSDGSELAHTFRRNRMTAFRVEHTSSPGSNVLSDLSVSVIRQAQYAYLGGPRYDTRADVYGINSGQAVDIFSWNISNSP